MSATKILVPIDFSDQSLIALGQATNLAAIKNSKIILLSVIEEQNIMSSLFFDDTSDELQNKVNLKLKDLADNQAKETNVEIETMVSKGRVFVKINEVAKMINVDLIIMGTSGKPTGVVKKFIGSNAERVVRLAHCPVITIKGSNHRDGCKNILLPLDLEKQTKEKVTYALEYARYWNATICVVSILLVDDPNVRNTLQKNLQQVEKFIKDANVKCTAELIQGEGKMSLGDFVIEYGNQKDVDLIMIMTKKEEISLSENISVTARHIINKSNIPVMSIRPVKQKYVSNTTAF